MKALTNEQMHAHMTDPRHERAAAIATSANRLVSLLKHGAPEVVIEAERWILTKRIASFPADAEQIAIREGVHDAVYREEQEHLHKTGFYDDILKDSPPSPEVKP